jgi:hypothetical protein
MVSTTGQVDAATTLAALERQLARLDEGEREGPSAVRPEIASLRDDLASHLLAARVLVDAGAADRTILPILERAARRLAAGLAQPPRQAS